MIALVKLKKGNVIFTKISRKDLPLLKKYNWTLSNDGYLCTSIPLGKYKTKTVNLHSLILNTKSGEFGDHRNRDTLDNMRKNLRVCNKFENAQNRVFPKNKSGYRGVYFDSNRGKYRAIITANGRRKSLGRFNKAEDAALEYDRYCKKLHGNFSVLNFTAFSPNRTLL